MATAAMLFNGIYFSFPLVDHAFAWAKKNHGSLLAIFLKAKTEKKEGYGFPSDLDAAENLYSDATAEGDDNRIIQNNLHMLERQAQNEQIELQTKLITEPSMQELQMMLNSYELIFYSEKFYNKDLLCVNISNLESLLKNSSVTLEMVSG